MTEASPSLLVLWRENPIFAAVDEPALAALCASCPAEGIAARTMILEAGMPVSALQVVLAGTVRVFHRSADGREAVVKLLRAPSVFAELELFHDLPMLECVDSVDDVRLARVPGPEYIALIHKFPAAMYAHLLHLSAAFCVAAKNEQQVFALLEQRIANLLLSYADLELPFRGSDGSEGGAGPLELPTPLSQNDIACSLGAVRRSVARILSGWQKAGVLEQSEGRWVLHKREDLEELAAPIRHSLNYQMGMSLRPLTRRQGLAQARLEITRGHPRWVGRSYEVEDQLIVGRQAPARLLLPSELLSPQHCRVFRAATGGRIWIEDLDSLNGCAVNDRKVGRQTVLRDGDRIQIGGFELCVHLERGAADGA
jgi:CRP-like cAMP-binding protein